MTCYRPFAARVARTERLSARFVRVTFTGDDLDRCAPTCLDQRVKLVLGDECQRRYLHHAPDWWTAWRSMPDQPPLRTYTVRAVRPQVGEIDIDFAVHGEGGPASRFALRATPGDEVLLVAPEVGREGADTVGLAWRPGAARRVVLIGDETAAPAICSIVESLPDDIEATALVEVPHDGDDLPVRSGPRARVTWLPRDGAAPGTALVPAVRAWAAEHGDHRPAPAHVEDFNDLEWEEGQPVASPEVSTPYVWLAGESAAVRDLRRLLLGEAGLARDHVSFMGYWNRSRAS